MKIVMAHNRYLVRGGEDECFDLNLRLFAAHGHEVIPFELDNDTARSMGPVSLGLRTIWNPKTYRDLRELIARERPAVVHFDNTLPLISPAAYYAARAEGVPVVQSLHNWRLMCTNGLMFRENRLCQDCVGKAIPWPGVLHGCYRDSRAASAAVAAMLGVHNALGTWRNTVDLYIAFTDFARAKFIEHGLPADKVMMRPHFLDVVPPPGDGSGGFALFAGRLSPEKGIATMLSAWRRLAIEPHLRPRLKIIGDGPMAATVAEAAHVIPGIEWLGRQPLDRVHELIGQAAVVIFPSEIHEAFGRVVMEAHAKGTPVIAADMPTMLSMVAHGRTGLLYRTGSADDLAATVAWAFAHPRELARMRVEARAMFERSYTPQRGYEQTLHIFEQAVSRSVKPLAAPKTVRPDYRPILGMRVDATSYDDASARIVERARHGGGGMVCVANVHMVMEAYDQPAFRALVNSADLVTPDGVPLVWVLRALGIKGQQRVYGPDLTLHLCAAAAAAGVPVGFHGGSPEVMEKMSTRLAAAYPDLKVAWRYSPPFRTLTDEEDERITKAIADSGARILFVGLGCPKQERWMAEHRDRIPAMLVGVGAAFDFHAGTLRQAPAWLQRIGLEWAFRLAMEPGRLWRRYAQHNPRFLLLAASQIIRTRAPL